MKIANIDEAKTHLSQLIESVLQGEDVLICQAGKPVVRLIPYSTSVTARQPGFWQGKVKMSADFDITPDEVINAFMGN